MKLGSPLGTGFGSELGVLLCTGLCKELGSKPGA